MKGANTINYESVNSTRSASISTDDVFRASDVSRLLTSDLNTYIGDDTPCIGVIAQELEGSEFEKFFIFRQPGEEGYLAVKAADLVFPLIATVQKMAAEIDYLKTKI